MNDEILKIIEPQFTKLPDDIKNAIVNGDIGGKLAEITKKYALHIDQAASLEMETMLVMVGLETSEDYVNNLIRELRVSKDKANEITADVNKKIFADIRASLQTLAAALKSEDKEEVEQIRATEDHSHLKKEDILREIEKPTPVAPIMPKRSVGGGLYSIGSKLRDREFEVVTDAKRMDDMRRTQLEEEFAAAAAEKKPAEPVLSIEEKLTEIVRAPMKEIEVKLPETKEEKKTESTPPSPTKIDPYRESV